MGTLGSFQGYTDSPLYLYNNGVWSNLQTTGVTATFLSPSGSSFSENVKGYLYLNASAGGNADRETIGRLNQTMDLTSYNYIKIECSDGTTDGTGTRIGQMGVSRENGLKSRTYDASMTLTNSSLNANTITYVINVSSLSGSYYIYFSLFSNAYCSNYTHIKKVYLTIT